MQFLHKTVYVAASTQGRYPTSTTAAAPPILVPTDHILAAQSLQCKPVWLLEKELFFYF